MKKHWLFLSAIAASVVLLDQCTKALVTANLAIYESWAPIPALAHLFDITHITNTGAVFGLFPDAGAVLLVVALVVSLGLIYYYRDMSEGGWATRLALGLMLGGSLGNLIDRVRLGHVTDFIHFSFWPVFNIADSCIVIGVLSLTVLIFWEERRENRAAQPANSDSDA